MPPKPKQAPASDRLSGAANAELARLVERIAACGGADTYFTEVEVNGWPVELVQALRALPLLTPASPVTHTECNGCEQACFMPVEVIPGTTPAFDRAFIACDKRDDIARVVVPISALAQLKSSGQMLADALVKLLGMANARPTPIAGLGWQLGTFEGTKHRSPLVLSLDLVPKLSIAGRTIGLTDVLRFKSGRLSMDQAALRNLVDNPTGKASEVEEDAADRAQRIHKRINELKKSKVKPYLQRVAEEFGLSKSRIKQIRADYPESKAGVNWFPDARAAKPSTSPKKSKRQH